MYDKNSGRSRGFGFVNFSNDHEAKCAKDAMDGKVQPYCFKNMSVIAVRNEALTYINSTGNARAAIANKFCSWKSPWRISYCSSTFYGEKKKLAMTCSFTSLPETEARLLLTSWSLEILLLLAFCHLHI